jgi:putative ABC transport system permease protein
MLLLAYRNLTGRPLRNGLAMAGLALGLAVLAGLSSFGNGYERALAGELNRMGLQMMLVPLGCPYDAAARVLKGRDLENSLPQSALAEARRDPAVAVAAPLLIVSLPRAAEARADMWVGLDESALALKPWWQAAAGEKWFTAEDSVILGSEAAEVEMRSPGDRFFSPETGEHLRVDGILRRSGTSDDNLFFVPLTTAQRMFRQPGRLTAIAIRLKDPALLRETSQRLQQIKGAQVVTLTEMMGTFLNLVGAVRSLLLSLALVAIAISVLSVFNTLLATVIDRQSEFSMLRALGASSWQIARLVSTEALMLTTAGSVVGMGFMLAGGYQLEGLVRRFVPFAPADRLFAPSAEVLVQTAAVGALVGIIARMYPAWRASRLHPAEALKAE